MKKSCLFFCWWKIKDALNNSKKKYELIKDNFLLLEVFKLRNERNFVFFEGNKLVVVGGDKNKFFLILI